MAQTNVNDVYVAGLDYAVQNPLDSTKDPISIPRSGGRLRVAAAAWTRVLLLPQPYSIRNLGDNTVFLQINGTAPTDTDFDFASNVESERSFLEVTAGANAMLIMPFLSGEVPFIWLRAQAPSEAQFVQLMPAQRERPA